jgi:uncharacterized LabA/DUF88 family protein
MDGEPANICKAYTTDRGRYLMRRKSKSKTTMNHQNGQTGIGTTSPVAPVALLIDGENAQIPDLIAHILVEAGKMGGVTIRQVYGNWAAPCMQSWRKQLTHYALDPMGNRPGHNATDIALVIGAMDLLHCGGIRNFCLVAGDSDYVPLVSRLRQGGCTVMVIGTSAVSSALKEACSVFLSTDQLLPQPSSRPTSSQANAHSLQSELSMLLTRAYHVATQKSKTEWVLLSALGLALRQLNPNFQVIYGKQKLSTLIKQHPLLFEIRQRISGNGQVGEVRLHSFT